MFCLTGTDRRGSSRGALYLGVFSLLLVLTTGDRSCQAQTGHILDAVGAVNQSMGGAGTALPLDSIGALHWNPASISALPGSEIGFAFMGMAPITRLSSRVDAGAFGPGMPAQTWEGTTTSDSEITPIPTMAVVHHVEDSPWTFGLGGFAIGGFGVNLPVTNANPLLSPPPAQGGVGYGGVYSQFQQMQFCPTAARRFGDGWSIGFAPTINWASLAVDPLGVAVPNANGVYPSAAHGDATWGLGYQVGLMHESYETGWNWGFSYKSPQWFQPFKFNSRDALGAARQLEFNLDYPAIMSLGVAYQGFGAVKIAADVRYIDYAHTDGFRGVGFNTNGSIKSFGWESIWVASIGTEITLTDNLQWRFGYTYNESPITNRTMFYGAPAPALTQHHLSTGFTRTLANTWTCTFAYHMGLRGEVTGSWWHPTLGRMQGTHVTGSLATHSLIGGIARRF
ncbi:MAG: outer membrane protein transport protein [Planctomycetales bacterium]|nr:outer membrane protein transport protein [Planctomycetales bacterium]